MNNLGEKLNDIELDQIIAEADIDGGQDVQVPSSPEVKCASIRLDITSGDVGIEFDILIKDGQIDYEEFVQMMTTN